MSKISYIHGPGQVPQNELPDRGREVKTAKPYIPYTRLTEGEMRLSLLREQLSIYAAAYPDYKQYAQGLVMVDNALNAGVSNGVNFIGAIPDNLQEVARQIRRASNMTDPATIDFIGMPRDLSKGVRIGADIVPVSIPDCEEYATRKANEFYGKNWNTSQYKNIPTALPGPLQAKKKRWLDYRNECQIQTEVERIMNDRLEAAAHHVLYKNISSNYPSLAGSRMDVKRLLHVSGIGALANAASVSPSMVQDWTEVGILRKNANVGAGVIGSVQSGFYVAGNDTSEEYDKYRAWITDPKKDKIGEPVTAIVLAVLGAVTAALAEARKFQAELNQKKALALSAAQGFGTASFSAEKNDINTQSNLGTGGGMNNLILPIGLAVAAFALMED